MAELFRAERLTRWSPQEWSVHDSWRPVVDAFLGSPAGRRLADFVQTRLDAGAVIYPPHPLRALEVTPLDHVHAVILGQDPYHGAGQAEGLAFSVPPGVKMPPSLRNIFKELHRGDKGPPPESGSLINWARNGVLLLNTSLTVEKGEPGSHANKGWEALTDALLAAVAAHASPCVYLLWGAHAQAKRVLVEQTAARWGTDILVLQANHPSPLSAARAPIPFLGCGHFETARAWLADRGHPNIL